MTTPSTPAMPEPQGLSSGIHLIALQEKNLPFTGHMVSFSNGDTRRAEWIARLNPRTETITRMIEADEVFRPLTQEVFRMGNPEITEEAKAATFKKLSDELDRWEAYFVKNAEKFEGGWVVGSSLSVADIALLPTLMMYVVRFGLDLSPRPHLAKWYTAMTARSSVQNAIPPHWAESPPKAQPFKTVTI
ncbi:glutathione S-transferase [Chytridium lagenaria]|nr:glutathione S-transferase [Chytridium lagenaria]